MGTSSLANSHPSYLALDRASLGSPSPEVSAHLDACAQCRAYVESLAQSPPASGFVRIRERLATRRRAARYGWVAFFPVAAAASVGLFLALQPQPGSRETAPYVGAKGFTSVWIYVKRGSVTELWDGRKPLVSGDRLRIKVDPGQFRRVEVYSVKLGETPALLYAGSVAPSRSVTLPDAWEVDSAPGPERLVVAFSNEPTKPSWPEWLRAQARPELSVLPFVLPKSAAGDPDSGPSAP